MTYMAKDVWKFLVSKSLTSLLYMSYVRGHDKLFLLSILFPTFLHFTKFYISVYNFQKKGGAGGVIVRRSVPYRYRFLIKAIPYRYGKIRVFKNEKTLSRF